jgi:hypothetical protein
MSLALARVNLLFLVVHQLRFRSRQRFRWLAAFPGAASGVGETTATVPLRISIVPLRGSPPESKLYGLQFRP